MFKKIHHLFIGTILLTSCLMAAGCVPLVIGAAAGAGGYSYFKGNLEENVDVPVARAHKASLSALKEQGIFIMDDDIEQHTATIKGEYPDGKNVRIDIQALTEKASKIKVRIGIVGDEGRSTTIMNAIKKKI